MYKKNTSTTIPNKNHENTPRSADYCDKSMVHGQLCATPPVHIFMPLGIGKAVNGRLRFEQIRNSPFVLSIPNSYQLLGILASPSSALPPSASWSSPLTLFHALANSPKSR